jgi:hypothetical protein
MKITKLALSIFLLCALQACGGGGGSGTGGGGSVVSSVPPGSFTISATTAGFTAMQGGAASAPQVLHVHLQDQKAAVLGAAYVAPQVPPSWLHVGITGAAPDYDVTLSITNTAFPPGTMTATVTLGTADSSGNILYTQAVQATLTILQPIAVNQATISDSFILGQAGALSTSTIAVTADPTTHWSVATSAPWIKASSTGGSASSSESITVDASSLPVGSATGTVTITNVADAADTATITVNVAVVAPTLTVSPSTITLGGTDGLSETPQPLQISLNTGTSTYPWTATFTTQAGGAWLTSDTAAGTVGSAGATVNLSANYAAVAAGTYTGSVQVQATVNGAVITQTIPVTLNKEQDWLYVSADGVAFSQFPSRSTLTRTLQVTSSEGLSDIPWTASSDQSWLSVTPSGTTGGSLILTANPAGLASDQEYIANVTITSSDASIGNSQQVRVGLWVGSADPGDVTISGTYDGLAANPVEPEVYATDGQSHVLVYNVYTGALLRTLTTSLAQATQIITSSDGTVLFVNDATNLETVSIDPETGATLQHYAWGTTGLSDVAYARPAGHPILVLGSGVIYNVASGQKYQATIGGPSFGFDNFSIAVDSAAHFLYTQDMGISPSTLTQYTLKYTALTTDGLVVTAGPSASAGYNGESICASADGSRVYSANGAPYDFPALSSSNLQQVQTLPAAPYPNDAVCGWNGLFVGGAQAYYNPTDVWVYEPDGTLLTTLAMHTPTENNLGDLVLSGDDTRVIGTSSDASLDFHSIPPP